MRELGTPKIGSHIMNSHIKRPRTTINWRIGSRKKAIFQLHIGKIADKKTAYNEGRLYSNVVFSTLFSLWNIIEYLAELDTQNNVDMRILKEPSEE
jgi:hypothetical protein